MWKFFNIAKKVAKPSHYDNCVDARGFYIGAVGIRKDGVIVKSKNGPVIMDESIGKTSYPAAHAEFRLARKLDKGAIVFVCRIRKGDNSFALARPCVDCQRKLISRGVKKVYYTISNTEYGVLFL